MMETLKEIIVAIPFGGWISLVGIIGYFVSMFMLRTHYRRKYDKNLRPFLTALSSVSGIITIKDNSKD